MNFLATSGRSDPRGSARRSPTAGNRGQGGKWLRPSTRRRIYERDGYRCVWCNGAVERPTKALEERRIMGAVLNGREPEPVVGKASIDHVVPRSRGGSNRPGNLITCCCACNAKRGSRSAPVFAVVLSPEHARSIMRRVRNAQRRNLPTRRSSH